MLEGVLLLLLKGCGLGSVFKNTLVNHCQLDWMLKLLN